MPALDPKRAILISDDAKVMSEVDDALALLSEIRIERQAGSLAAFLSQTPDMPENCDVILFRTEPEGDADVAAVAAIRQAVDRRVVIIALTDESIPISFARKLNRAGVDEVLPWPTSPTELRDLVQRWTRPNPLVLVHPGHSTPHRQGKIIAIARARGGIGATTLAVNLADRLLDRSGMMRKTVRNEVALVDLDMQFGAVASFLDIEPRDTLFQLAADGILPDALFLKQAMVQHSSGLSVLTAPGRFAPLDALSQQQVGAMLDHLRADFDYIVVDLPHALVQWLGPLVERTHKMLLMTDTGVPSIRQARKLIDVFTEDNLTLKIEMVVSGESKPMITPRHHAEAAKVLERPLRHWLPDDRRTARAAADRGMTLGQVSSRAALTKAVAAIGKSILADPAETAKAAAKTKTQ